MPHHLAATRLERGDDAKAVRGPAHPVASRKMGHPGSGSIPNQEHASLRGSRGHGAIGGGLDAGTVRQGEGQRLAVRAHLPRRVVRQGAPGRAVPEGGCTATAVNCATESLLSLSKVRPPGAVTCTRRHSLLQSPNAADTW